VLETVDEVAAVTISRTRLYNDLRHETGPFDAARAAVETFIDGLVSHYLLDGGRLVVSHAGLVERMHGRTSGRVRAFCLYGETTGETDEFGLPVRYPWASEGVFGVLALESEPVDPRL